MLDDAKPRRLRNRFEEIFYACLGVVFLVVTVGLVVIFLTSHDDSGNLGTWGALAVMLVLGVSSLAFARTAVLIAPDSDSFEVRNSWSRKRISWSEVKAFRTGTYRGILTRYGWPCVAVELAGGQTINCQALTGARRVPGYIAELQAEMERHTGERPH